VLLDEQPTLSPEEDIMRAFKFSLATAVLATVIVGLAMAQPPGGGAGRGMGGMRAAGGLFLLRSPDVQKELKLTDDQKTKLEDAVKKQTEKQQEQRAAMKEGGFDKDKMQAMMKEMTDAADKAVKEILNADQQKRLKQIGWQQIGSAAFTEKDVETALKLTDEQKDKIKGLNEEMRNDMREIFQSAGGNQEEVQTKMAALRKETMEKAEGVLTNDQKKHFKELLGAKFEGKIEMGMGGAQGKGGRNKDKKGGDKKDPDKKDGEKPKRGDGV
jgi:Spy/CpxP family protein refolding chaperone